MIVQPVTPLSALRTFPLLRRGKHSQSGAAILLAMLVVTLVATLAAGLQWRQWRAYSQEAGVRTQSQAAWVLVGALDWARLILREDARANASVDHLGEPWALPLQEAKLSSFLSADALTQAGQDEAYLSGQIVDAQSKLNLTNLTTSANVPSGSIALDKVMLGALYRLYQQLQLPLPELVNWTEQWRLADPALPAPTTAAGPTPLRPSQVQQLTWLGISPASAAALAPYLTILPERTAVNLNTASALVLHAAIPQLDVSQAARLVDARAQKPFQNLADAQRVLASTDQLDATTHSVASRFFEVRGKLRLGDWVIEESSLVQRSGQDVKALWRRRE